MKRKHIFLSVAVVLILTSASCQSRGLPTLTVTPNYALTEIAESVGVLKSELTRLAPTLTIISINSQAGVNQATATILVSPSLELSATPTITPGNGEAAQQTAASPTSTTLDLSRAPAPSGQVILQDDFSSRRGWFTEKSDRYIIYFDNDGYRFYIKTKNSPIWSVRSIDIGNVEIETDASQLGGEMDGYFGLVCRHVDRKNYYMLVMSPNGQLEIAKMKNNQLSILVETTAQPNIINSEVNRLRADCVGNRLIFYINERKVLETTDNDFVTGAVGLVAGNRSRSGTDIIFDNFVARTQ
jgi:hypothetical protein